MGDLFFESPKAAVEKITELLINQNWKELGRYYDLSNTDITEEELNSEDFYIRKERPEAAHPGGFWRYKRLFSPSFEYSFFESIGVDKVLVWVKIEIDQGEGMIQEGKQSFEMRKSDKGFQILPS